MRYKWSSICTVLLLSAANASAAPSIEESVMELRRTVEELREVVKSQAQELSELKKSSATATTSAAVASPIITSSSAVGKKQFNPDIGVVGDIVAKSTQSDEDDEGNDRISLREIELLFGHDVDPYSRFDATIAFSDAEDPDVEEAYLTHWGLPYEFKMKLGKIKPRLGIAVSQHRDSLETVDEPFVVSQLFGEEGFSKSGVEFSNFLPLPWESVTHEVIAGVLQGGNGGGGTLFGDTERRMTYFARLRNAWDINDESSFDLGTTFLLGSADEDSANEVRAFGIDTDFIHYFNAINRLKLQAEIYFQDRSAPAVSAEEESDSVESDSDGTQLFRDNPYGYYLLADYRLSERWGAAVRYDRIEEINLSEDLIRDVEDGYSAVLSFYQSEFARWRLQYQYAELAEGGIDNRFFLQGTFAIGVHKHSLN